MKRSLFYATLLLLGTSGLHAFTEVNRRILEDIKNSIKQNDIIKYTKSLQEYNDTTLRVLNQEERAKKFSNLVNDVIIPGSLSLEAVSPKAISGTIEFIKKHPELDAHSPFFKKIAPLFEHFTEKSIAFILENAAATRNALKNEDLEQVLKTAKDFTGKINTATITEKSRDLLMSFYIQGVIDPLLTDHNAEKNFAIAQAIYANYIPTKTFLNDTFIALKYIATIKSILHGMLTDEEKAELMDIISDLFTYVIDNKLFFTKQGANTALTSLTPFQKSFVKFTEEWNPLKGAEQITDANKKSLFKQVEKIRKQMAKDYFGQIWGPTLADVSFDRSLVPQP